MRSKGGFEFLLGTHVPRWLGESPVPLFVSRRRLCRVRTKPVAVVPWALDSGGFSELSMFGAWETGPAEYADEVIAWSGSIGRLRWAAIMDWMCEPSIVAKTGKSVAEHQELTVRSYLDLKALAPGMPWAPVLQGWRVEDYHVHVAMYRSAGIDLHAAPVVGVGSVCRRQGTKFAWELFSSLSRYGFPLHGFGLKTLGLATVSAFLASSDSLAWSYHARRRPPLFGCPHKSCANCMRYAVRWRDALVESSVRPCQLPMFA